MPGLWIRTALFIVALLVVGGCGLNAKPEAKPEGKGEKDEPYRFLAAADAAVKDCRAWSYSTPRTGIKVLRAGGKSDDIGRDGSVCEVVHRPGTYRVAFIPFITVCGSTPIQSMLTLPDNGPNDGVAVDPVFRVEAVPAEAARLRNSSRSCVGLSRPLEPTAVHYVETDHPERIRVIYVEP